MRVLGLGVGVREGIAVGFAVEGFIVGTRVEGLAVGLAVGPSFIHLGVGLRLHGHNLGIIPPASKPQSTVHLVGPAVEGRLVGATGRRVGDLVLIGGGLLDGALVGVRTQTTPRFDVARTKTLHPR